MQIADTEIARKSGLYGEEDIGFEDLVDVHLVDSETQLNMDELTWLESDEEKVAEQRKRMKSLMLTLLTEIPLKSQEEHIQMALDSLVTDYIAMDLESKYALIHSDLFNLERVINIDNNGRNISVKLPSFASAKFGQSEWEYDSICEGARFKDKIHLSSKAPPIIKKAKDSAKKFARDYFESVSKGLEDDVVGDLLLRSNDGIKDPLNLMMYWIPLPSELNIEVETIDKDPILIAHSLGRNFLVAKWDVEGEQPYEHYLREFEKKSLANLGYSVRADD